MSSSPRTSRGSFVPPTRLESLLEHGNVLEITGVVAPAVRFLLRLPIHWDGRLIMLAQGGYGGVLSFDLWPSAPAGSSVMSGSCSAVVTHDTGHRQPAGFPADGSWAWGAPRALVDFAYEGSHKVVVVAREILRRAFGRPVEKAYFLGCSSAGRLALQHVQRYPGDFDGLVADSPTIDMIATNTFWHAWNARAATGADGRAVLGPRQLVALNRAALARARLAGVEEDGAITDPSSIEFDARDLVGSGDLTPQQAATANALYGGPRTADGERLMPGGMPYGSEMSWAGGVVPDPPDARMSTNTSAEYAYSHDFPLYMSSLTPSSDRVPVSFDIEAFERMHELTGIMDPTDPDISAFRQRGGKLIIWQGWADASSHPLSSLDYATAVRRELGTSIDDLLALFMVPGMHHCGAASERFEVDYLTPLIDWVERGKAPGEIVVAEDDGIRRIVQPSRLEGRTVTAWAGSSRYARGHTRWYKEDGGTLAAAPVVPQELSDSAASPG